MLINNEKTVIDTNTPLDGYHLIDELKEEGQILGQKIKNNYPYFDFVLDKEGNLIDITPKPRPEPEPIIKEPTTEEMLLQAYLKISELENRLQTLEGSN